MDISTPPPTLSVNESAALLGVSRWAVYDAVTRGEIDAVRVGSRIRVATRPLLARLGMTSIPEPETP